MSAWQRAAARYWASVRRGWAEAAPAMAAEPSAAAIRQDLKVDILFLPSGVSMTATCPRVTM